MATRFYFEPLVVPAGLALAFDAGWTSATAMVRRWMFTSKTAATETVQGTVSGLSSENAGAYQLYSRALAAQTISGNINLVTRALESATNDNINTALTVIKLVTNDGGTVRATLRAFGEGGGNSELGTTAAGRSHMVNASGNLPQSAEAGDRILLEYGYGHSAAVTGTTPQFDAIIGGSGTDHANSNGDTTGSVPWLEFSADLTFLSAGPPPWRRRPSGLILR